MKTPMCREKIIRLFAGAPVMLGVLLTVSVNRWWLILPAFVGLNLFQSSLTGFCPLEIILKKAGVKDKLEACQSRSSDSIGPAKS